jgi:hypothetical protein
MLDFSLFNLKNLSLAWVANMDELEALMEHHIEQAEYGVSMCTRAMSRQFDGITQNARETAAQCQPQKMFSLEAL